MEKSNVYYDCFPSLRKFSPLHQNKSQSRKFLVCVGRVHGPSHGHHRAKGRWSATHFRGLVEDSMSLLPFFSLSLSTMLDKGWVVGGVEVPTTSGPSPKWLALDYALRRSGQTCLPFECWSHYLSLTHDLVVIPPAWLFWHRQKHWCHTSNIHAFLLPGRHNKGDYRKKSCGHKGM